MKKYFPSNVLDSWFVETPFQKIFAPLANFESTLIVPEHPSHSFPVFKRLFKQKKVVRNHE